MHQIRLWSFVRMSSVAFIFNVSDDVTCENGELSPWCLHSNPQGVYYQTGDVIKVTDEEDGKPYYAQIRGFMQDQYCEKSAALTWLIPTQSSPKDQFDPGTYIVGEQWEITFLASGFGKLMSCCFFFIGPEEDLPRKLEYLEFVCHAPSEYFKSRSSPFPTIPIRPEKGYIWTHIGSTPAFTVKESVSGSS